jgi:hypothetical protein
MALGASARAPAISPTEDGPLSAGEQFLRSLGDQLKGGKMISNDRKSGVTSKRRQGNDN